VDRAGRTGSWGEDGAGPINYSDADQADFLPRPLGPVAERYERIGCRRSIRSPGAVANFTDPPTPVPSTALASLQAAAGG
jgi:hypothetical protein